MVSLVEAEKDVSGGGFNLFLGNAASTAILAVESIVVARLLGPSDYCLISPSPVFPSSLVSLVDLGISSALVKYPAQHGEAASQYAEVSALFKLPVGAASVPAMGLSANSIATEVDRSRERIGLMNGDFVKRKVDISQLIVQLENIYLEAVTRGTKR